MHSLVGSWGKCMLPTHSCVCLRACVCVNTFKMQYTQQPLTLKWITVKAELMRLHILNYAPELKTQSVIAFAYSLY